MSDANPTIPLPTTLATVEPTHTSVPRRPRVREWRLTRREGWLIARLWVESDPAFGGFATFAEAEDALLVAMRTIREKLSETDRMQPDPRQLAAPVGHQEFLAGLLLEALPAANSVEVCDSRGEGVALHRDWP